MSTVLRRFKDTGVNEFIDRINQMRAGHDVAIDDSFLTDSRLTEVVKPSTTIEHRRFASKREAGQYLSDRTKPAREVLGDDDQGLWTWLSAWHWDEVCPIREDGRRKVLNPLSYVYGYGFVMRKKQHLLAASTLIYEAFPDSRVLLDGPVSTLTQAVHEVFTRVWLMRIRGMGALIDALYWDDAKKSVKRGINDNSARSGDLRNRLTTRIRQLEKTYDLIDLTADQLLNLLGDEFKAWTNGRTPPRPKHSKKTSPQGTLFEDA